MTSILVHFRLFHDREGWRWLQLLHVWLAGYVVGITDKNAVAARHGCACFAQMQLQSIGQAFIVLYDRSRRSSNSTHHRLRGNPNLGF
jgi:hypothetical protein